MAWKEDPKWAEECPWGRGRTEFEVTEEAWAESHKGSGFVEKTIENSCGYLWSLYGRSNVCFQAKTP